MNCALRLLANKDVAESIGNRAKGPGPGRLGLRGQGSWAGPAWLGGAKGPGPDRLGLGGPRVLGRTGLAWGAKGPGPDRLGLGGQGSWAGPAWLA